MKIKEVENLLSVSRSNIRFYEKEGLLNPERKANNYREYSEEDIAVLKKILVLRKLGFSVEEISLMQKGELSLAEASYENISRLEKEIASLQGALKITKSLSTENTSFETLDQERLWNDIVQSENTGQGFVDICKDYLFFEQHMFDTMWKYVFFHNLEKSRKKYGALVAYIIVLLICVVRGIANLVIWNEPFWIGFSYPIILFAIGSIIILPIYILNKKSPKVASVVCNILVILGIILIAFFVLLIVIGIIKLNFS